MEKRLAAVDIGSNAARLLICRTGESGAEKVMAARIPLRLGSPVFMRGEIGEESGMKLVQCMRGFRWLCESQGVDRIRARATSAMREARDGAEWARRGGAELGAEIRVIDGREEAAILAKSVGGMGGKLDGVGVLLDVGGGSADACVFRGVEVLEAESFGLGTVRFLAGAILESERRRFGGWLGRVAREHGVLELTACGGNIRRLGKILGGGKIRAAELEKLRGKLAGMTAQERAVEFGLRADRADVIAPAAEIYCEALRSGGFAALRIPRNAGLTDGMIREMTEQK